MEWHLWVIAAVVLFIAEVFTPGFVVACFGAACLLSGIAAALNLGPNVQIIVFCISSAVSFVAIRPLMKKYLWRSDPGTKTNVNALVGKTGLVTEKIVPLTSQGRVVVGGEDWRGASVDETEIEAGMKIIVTDIDGTKLIVKPVQNSEEK